MVDDVVSNRLSLPGFICRFLSFERNESNSEINFRIFMKFNNLIALMIDHDTLLPNKS